MDVDVDRVDGRTSSWPVVDVTGVLRVEAPGDGDADADGGHGGGQAHGDGGPADADQGGVA